VTTYQFSMVLARHEDVTDDELGALSGRGCDDASFGLSMGVLVADFDRESESAERAMATARDDVEEVLAPVHHAEPSDHVSVGEVAERLGRTRESIRLLASGERGPGHFPIPVAGVTDQALRLWYWPDVVAWWSDIYEQEIDPVVEELAYAIADFNELLRREAAQTSIASALGWLQEDELRSVGPWTFRPTGELHRTRIRPGRHLVLRLIDDLRIDQLAHAHVATDLHALAASTRLLWENMAWLDPLEHLQDEVHELLLLLHPYRAEGHGEEVRRVVSSWLDRPAAHSPHGDD
jgi:hypothetical protein